MYFLIACRDEPFRSFRSLMAARTISDAGGWLGLTRGFVAFAAAFFGVAGDAAAGADSVATLSVIFTICFEFNSRNTSKLLGDKIEVEFKTAQFAIMYYEHGPWRDASRRFTRKVLLYIAIVAHFFRVLYLFLM